MTEAEKFAEVFYAAAMATLGRGFAPAPAQAQIKESGEKAA